jgi:peptide/nickel transport system permease protein
VNAVGKLLIHRLALGFLSLVAVSIIVFSSVKFLPGDFAHAVLGQQATPDAIAALRAEVGLDDPPVYAYLSWASKALRGEFGLSFSGRGDTRREVGTVIWSRLGNTLFLAGFAALVAVPISIALGILCAARANSAFDRITGSGALAAISTPDFFIAYLLVLLFAVDLRWFPALSSVSSDTSFVERVQRCVLPMLTLVLVSVGYIMRQTRVAILTLWHAPYVETAILKGASRWRVVTRHILPNAWAPIANVTALSLAYLIVGVVVVEVVFAYPGIGRLMVDSVSSRDIPVVQGCVLVFASAYIMLNLLADLVSIVMNPRLMYPK